MEDGIIALLRYYAKRKAEARRKLIKENTIAVLESIGFVALIVGIFKLWFVLEGFTIEW